MILQLPKKGFKVVPDTVHLDNKAETINMDKGEGQGVRFQYYKHSK